MRERVHYCPLLGHNVIIQGRIGAEGKVVFECLNKGDCGYKELGCRNLLFTADLHKNPQLRQTPVDSHAAQL